jgi:hypothetical protein
MYIYVLNGGYPEVARNQKSEPLGPEENEEQQKCYLKLIKLWHSV